MPTPAEKGDALHQAVSAIEQHILHTSPALKEKTFVFEDKKIVCVGGVRHEIDIFVTVDPAPGYAAVHIFECNNWKKSVGKNEIVDFSEKIRAVKAAHGYFVAKSFTRDARAQAKKDERLTLLVASERDPTELPIPNDLHFLFALPTGLDATFFRRGSDRQSLPLDMNTATATAHGTGINLREYLFRWADDTMSENTLTFPSRRLGEGDYERTADCRREFREGEFSLNGHDIESAAICARFRVGVRCPPIVSRFEVESRGRVLSLASIILPHVGAFQMKVVQGPEVLLQSRC
jgi:hypothetical protein